MNIRRFKSIVHPEGYGFWLDPDGAFTLLGSVTLAALVMTVTGYHGGWARWIGEYGTYIGDGGTVWRLSLAVTVSLGLILATLWGLSGARPNDHAETDRFHLFAMIVGWLTTVAVVTAWSTWEALNGRTLTTLVLSWVTTICIVVAAGWVFRSHQIARHEWIAADAEESAGTDAEL
jgi:hypothetical protein